jgi:hypothetical protein
MKLAPVDAPADTWAVATHGVRKHYSRETAPTAPARPRY